MEVQGSTPKTDSGRIWETPNHEPRILVVVVDASRKLQLAPLKYALEISEPGDKLYVLGILHQVTKPMGYKQRADPGNSFNGANRIVIVGQQRKTAAAFKKCMNDPDLQRLFASKQVNPVVQIAPGPDRKKVTARQAVKLGAKWVILEKHLKRDRSYLKEHLDCNLVLMKPKNQKVFIKFQGQNVMKNLPDYVDSDLVAPREFSNTERSRNERQPTEVRHGETTRYQDFGLPATNDMGMRALPIPVEIEVSESSSSAHHLQESRLGGRFEALQLWTTFVRLVVVTEFVFLYFAVLIFASFSNHAAHH